MTSVRSVVGCERGRRDDTADTGERKRRRSNKPDRRLPRGVLTAAFEDAGDDGSGGGGGETADGTGNAADGAGPRTGMSDVKLN